MKTPSILAAACASILLVQSTQAFAQSDEKCTSTALNMVLKTFAGSLNIWTGCDVSLLSSAEETRCDSGWPTEALDTRLSSKIADLCTGSGDRLCASTAAGQYSTLLRVASTPGNTPELDSNLHGCREAISRATDKLGRKRAATMRKCNDRALAGDTSYGPAGADCTDTAGATLLKIERAQEKLRRAIYRGCGGPDGIVGGGDDVDPQDDLQLLETCDGGSDCQIPIPGLAELADCLICTAEQEIGEATTGALKLPLGPIESCRVRLDHEYAEFASDIFRSRSSCEEDRLSDPDAPACPSERILERLADSRAQAETRVADACGSLDPQDDLGFPSSCPDVGTCAAVDVSAMAGQIQCLTCVTEARAQELVAAAYRVSAFEPDVAKRNCREAIGTHIADEFPDEKLSRLARCERAARCGTGPDVCPDPSGFEDIEEARAQAVYEMSYYCAVGEGAFIDPQDLGYDPTCPDVLGCGSQETDTFAGLSACLICLADSTVDDLRSLHSPWP